MLSLTPCALAVIFSADIYTYPLMVLNIFQESEADIEDFMQQKLDAEEGVGFIIYCLFLIVNLTFYIHAFGTCILCLTEFVIKFSHSNF